MFKISAHYNNHSISVTQLKKKLSHAHKKKLAYVVYFIQEQKKHTATISTYTIKQLASKTYSKNY